MCSNIYNWAGTLLVASISILAFVGVLWFIRTFGQPLWSQEAAGWAQAVGSIAAIGVAIYVMKTQNAHAIHVMTSSERFAALRKAEAVLGVAEQVQERVIGITKTLANRASKDSLDLQKRRIKMLLGKVQALEEAVLKVPAHELGTYEMAKAVHIFGQFLSQYSAAMAEMDQWSDALFAMKRLELDVVCGLMAGPILQLRTGVQLEREALERL